MDDNGFIFTLDAALGLAIIFIVLAAVANVNIPSSSQIRLSHNAQDTLETMGTYKTDPDGFTVLQNVAFALAANNNDQKGIDDAEQTAGAYLNQTLGNVRYNLTETNQLNATIAANADMKNANDIAVGAKNCGDYTFRLYVWD